MPANAPYYARRFNDTACPTNHAYPLPVLRDDHGELSSPIDIAQSDIPPHSPSRVKHPARPPSAENPYEETHNFEDLLVAAHTAAARQAARKMSAEQIEWTAPTVSGKLKRARVSRSPLSEVTPADKDSITKRQRVGILTESQFHSDEQDAPMRKSQSGSECLLENARAVGVHSAAALFRRTTDRKSRKYTRPPMSKLFMSLQLTPENFLQLQSQAKTYMLDPAHPERQNCVGNRGKGDTEMVKLRLFNCVHDFLGDGAGVTFFGEQVEKPGYMETFDAARALGEDNVPVPEDRLTWPRDGNKIISLVTPLMRRMVTNERQRQYAIETRKGGTKKRDGDSHVESPASQENSSRSAKPLTPNQSHLPCLETHQGSNTFESYASPLEQATLSLTATPPHAPHLSHINIFLAFKAPSSKSAVKIGETRIVPTPSCPQLSWYEWSDLEMQVQHLIARAQVKYPDWLGHGVSTVDANENATRLEPSYTQGSRTLFLAGVEEVEDDGISETTSLRSLAAAANELHQSDYHQQHRQQQQQQHTDADADVNSVTNTTHNKQVDDYQGQDRSPGPDHLHHSNITSAYTIKSVCSSGWKHITTEQDWYTLLREKALAIWADGVCNVLVEIFPKTQD